MRHAMTLVMLLLLPVALPAQAPGPLQLEDWRRDRANVLAYIEAMPESALTFRPTPGVRTFAEQIEHIVATNTEATALALGIQAPAPGDSAQYLHHKAALRAFATAGYDFVLGAIGRASTGQWGRRVSVYNQPPQLPARWLELSHEHAVWTLGQVVPYLRLNRVNPPSYQMPF